MGHIPVLSVPFIEKRFLPFGLLLATKKFHDLKLINFVDLFKNLNMNNKYLLKKIKIKNIRILI